MMRGPAEDEAEASALVDERHNFKYRSCRPVGIAPDGTRSSMPLSGHRNEPPFLSSSACTCSMTPNSSRLAPAGVFSDADVELNLVMLILPSIKGASRNALSTAARNAVVEPLEVSPLLSAPASGGC